MTSVSLTLNKNFIGAIADKPDFIETFLYIRKGVKIKTSIYFISAKFRCKIKLFQKIIHRKIKLAAFDAPFQLVSTSSRFEKALISYHYCFI
jgi:hypothetical protein